MATVKFSIPFVNSLTIERQQLIKREDVVIVSQHKSDLSSCLLTASSHGDKSDHKFFTNW